MVKLWTRWDSVMWVIVIHSLLDTPLEASSKIRDTCAESGFASPPDIRLWILTRSSTGSNPGPKKRAHATPSLEKLQCFSPELGQRPKYAVPHVSLPPLSVGSLRTSLHQGNRRLQGRGRTCVCLERGLKSRETVQKKWWSVLRRGNKARDVR
jgi:hypothetical protein